MEKNSSRLLIIFFVLLASCAAGPKTTRIHTEPVTNDPEVRHGVLSNGLSYYVLSNDKPSGMAELRLVVGAGSAAEDDDQLGLAHFLEHMLFNGTEKYPGDELVKILQSFGMNFGADTCNLG